ncbi:hypothetical protein WJX77_005690 [Trebouxia sp. C0004]
MPYLSWCKISRFITSMQLFHQEAELLGARPPDNILVLVEAGHFKQLRLVDFDWAGVAGSTQYPVLLNAKTIVWPEGVGPGHPLQQKHDIELLQYQVNPATRAAVNEWRQMFANSVQVSNMEVDS